MGEAALPAAEGAYGGEVERGLAMLRERFGDGRTFAYHPDHGFLMVEDDQLGSLKKDATAEGLAAQIEGTTEARQ